MNKKMSLLKSCIFLLTFCPLISISNVIADSQSRINTKSEANKQADELATAIKRVITKGEGAVSRSKASETAKIAATKITNAATFKTYSGINLTQITNISSAKFLAQVSGNSVNVKIRITNTSKGYEDIYYVITSFAKSEANKQADALVAAIKRVIIKSEGPVSKSKASETAKIATAQITDAATFKTYSGIDLTNIDNIKDSDFSTQVSGNSVDVEIRIANTSKGYEYIYYTITSFAKSEANKQADALVAAIKRVIIKSEGPVSKSKASETAKIATAQITDAATFKTYSGIDLTQITNISAAKFSAKVIGNNNVIVAIQIANTSKGYEDIYYTITSFAKSEANKQADALVAAIKRVIIKSEGPVSKSKASETAKIATAQITDAATFKTYSGIDLTNIDNIKDSDFSTQVSGNSVDVEIRIANTSKGYEYIYYTITSFAKSEANKQADALVAAIKRVIIKSEGPVSKSKASETAKIATAQITDAATFKTYSGIDLTNIDNIKDSDFSTQVSGNSVDVEIRIANTSKGYEYIYYTITSFAKSEANKQADALVAAIKRVIIKSEGPVSKSKANKTAKIAAAKITDAATFKTYSGIDLTQITNISAAKFSAKVIGNNNVIVAIQIANTSKGYEDIYYTITSFAKSEANKQADALVAAIKRVIIKSEGPVSKSKASETAKIATAQITDAATFKTYSGIDLTNIDNIKDSDFSTQVSGNSVDVEIRIANTSKGYEYIYYTITSFAKSEANKQADALVAAIKRVIIKSEGPVSKSKASETAKIAAAQITDVATFKTYSGINLTQITNISAAKFSAKVIGNNNVIVAIQIANTSKGYEDIYYTITSFAKSEANKQADALVASIKRVIIKSEGPVSKSKASETAKIATAQITDAATFKTYSGIDLTNIDNIKDSDFSTQVSGNSVDVEIRIANTSKGYEYIYYTITSFAKSEANKQADALVVAIKRVIIKSEGPVSKSKANETAKIAAAKITDAATFKTYSGIDLTQITNISAAKFSAKVIGNNNVIVAIQIANTSKGYEDIYYTITSFAKSEANKQADALVAAIKRVIIKSEGPVSKSKASETAKIATAQITDAATFKTYSGIDLTQITNISAAKFLVEIIDNSVNVRIVITNTSNGYEDIYYTIIGFAKSDANKQADALVAAIKRVITKGKGAVSRSKTSENAKIAAAKITNAATFKTYSGIDLTRITNISAAKFSAQVSGNSVNVIIQIANTSKGSLRITYTITGFKTASAQNMASVQTDKALFNDFNKVIIGTPAAIADGEINNLSVLTNLKGHGDMPSATAHVSRNFKIVTNRNSGIATVTVTFTRGAASTSTTYTITGFKTASAQKAVSDQTKKTTIKNKKQTNSKKFKKGLSGGIIAAISIASIFGIGLLGFGLIKFFKKRKSMM